MQKAEPYQMNYICSADVDVVEVADGKSGEFFFGIFKPYGHEWLEDVEFRRSFTES